MSRTERDVMHGKRIAVYDELHIEELRAQAETSLERQSVRQLYEDTLRVSHVYQHYCSPYCLIHWKKHYDRKVYRQHVKSALREARWDDAKHLRPKHLPR